MDISQAKIVIDVASGGTFNDGADKKNIKGIRADAAGIVNIADEAGNSASFNCLQGEVLPVQGKIELVNTTAVKVQVLI